MRPKLPGRRMPCAGSNERLTGRCRQTASAVMGLWDAASRRPGRERRSAQLAETLDVEYAVSADGRRVAEAEVGGIVAARELVAAAIAAGSELAWAHSAADLSSLE